MKYFLGVVIFCVSILHAGSLILINDTKYEMEVIIEGNDGTVFPPLIILGGKTERWNDNRYTHSRFLEEQNENRNKNLSVTPYTVTWRLASDKEFYSKCRGVRSAATITADHCKQNER